MFWQKQTTNDRETPNKSWYIFVVRRGQHQDFVKRSDALYLNHSGRYFAMKGIKELHEYDNVNMR